MKENKKNKKKLIIIISIGIMVLLLYLTIQYLRRLSYDPENPYRTIKEAAKDFGYQYVRRRGIQSRKFYNRHLCDI